LSINHIISPYNLANSEERMNASYLEILTSKIKDKETEIVSFDFFDTLMSRRVPFPKDIFWILGNELSKLKMLKFDVTPERFQALRMRAEQKARDASSAKEIDITAIYNQFPSNFFNSTIEQLIRIEVETEKRFLFPSADMVDAIKLAHKRGKRIIIVSDIYLHADHLKYFWGDSTPGVEITFFVSSEYKFGKYDKLFDIVLKKLKCKPNAVVHTGDNYVSDVEVPSRKGIRTCFVPHGSSSYWKTFDSEVSAAEHLNDRVCGEHGDLGVNALRCKVMLHRGSDAIDATSLFRYGAQILGPVFAPFIHWVNAVSIEDDIQVVLPLMREGYMIDKLLGSYPNVVSKPAYLSRRVLFQAGLVSADRTMLEELKFGNLTSSVGAYLELIGLFPSDAPELKAMRKKCISDPNVFMELISFLTESPALMSTIQSRALEIRTGIVAHLKSLIYINGSYAKKVALVDVGWNATIQRLLQKILDGENIKTNVVGLYMMTTPSVNELIFEGVFAKGFYVDGGYPAHDFSTLSRTLEIFEQSCAPPHGSVLRHDPATGQAILKPDLIPASQRADIDDIQEGILVFNSIYRRNICADTSAEKLTKLAPKYRPILRRAMLAPTQKEAQLFAKWQHDDNLASGGVMPILGNENARTFIKYKTMQQFMDTPMSELYWPAAALVLQDPNRARYLAVAAINNLPISTFDTDLLLASELASEPLPIGAPTTPQFTTKNHQHIFTNASGKTYLRFIIEHEEQIMLRWTPLSKAFDLRIDFVTLIHTPTGGLPTYHRLEGDEFQSDFAVSVGMIKYDSAGWRGKENGSAFYIKDLSKLGMTGSGTLCVEIACEIKILEDSGSTQGNSDGISLPVDAVVKPAHCFIEAFNGAAIDKGQSVLKSDDGIVSLSGWMIDPEFKKADGNFFMRLTNPIGQSQFIQMNAVQRPDVANQLKKETMPSVQADLGFSLTSHQLPAGNYTAAVVRKGSDYIQIGKESWQISVGGTLQ
jgi:predicted HAD superfamily hydrolase